MGKTGSLEQCASSESVHDESYGNQEQDMKASMFMSNQEMSPSASQGAITQPVVQFPYAYPDPFYGGLYTMYGAHNAIQSPLMAAAVGPGRVPLPVDIPEDGPIYVNAKQYHGILRRRQTRAKLEAQNKLVKTRKPYLHESRHQHALNRVRGSGGRFLSTKKAHSHSDSAPPSSTCSTPMGTLHFNEKLNSSSSNKHQIEANDFMATSTTQGIPASTASDGRFSTIPPHMGVPMQGGGSGGLAYSGSRCYASIVR